MHETDDDLRGSGAANAGTPAPIEPHLTVGEEMVLLALHYKGHGVEEAVQLWYTAYEQPGGYREAVASLEAAGLVERHGLLHHAAPTANAQIDARTQRLVHVIQAPAALSEEDGDLLVGLAASGALVLGATDRLLARNRMASLGQDGPLSLFVKLFSECNGITSPAALADAVLPLDGGGKGNPAATTAAIASNLTGGGGLGP